MGFITKLLRNGWTDIYAILCAYRVGCESANFYFSYP